jgi:hypothetical protein
MILQKEWLDKAEKNAEETTPTTGNQTLYSTAINAARYDYIQGATEMLNAVEALVNSKREDALKQYLTAQDEDESTHYSLIAVEFALLLNQLKSIKPLIDV